MRPEMEVGMFKKKTVPKQTYDKTAQIPVLKCSICTGEQVAGFKDLRTGRFEEVCLIRSPQELERFLAAYDLKEIKKEY